MNLGIKGKRALVMGGSSGIGLGVAHVLINEVADLYLADEARRVSSSIEHRFGGIDILVTHNGGPPKGRFEELSASDWQRGFDGLWQSVVSAIQVALPGMRKRGFGRIYC
jgi:3-oxoacyl-[acyl-carrier protein] reductase